MTLLIKKASSEYLANQNKKISNSISELNALLKEALYSTTKIKLKGKNSGGYQTVIVDTDLYTIGQVADALTTITQYVIDFEGTHSFEIPQSRLKTEDARKAFQIFMNGFNDENEAWEMIFSTVIVDSNFKRRIVSYILKNSKGAFSIYTGENYSPVLLKVKDIEDFARRYDAHGISDLKNQTPLNLSEIKKIKDIILKELDLGKDDSFVYDDNLKNLKEDILPKFKDKMNPTELGAIIAEYSWDSDSRYELCGFLKSALIKIGRK